MYERVRVYGVCEGGRVFGKWELRIEILSVLCDVLCFASFFLLYMCKCVCVWVGWGVLWTLVSAAMLMGCMGRVEVLWTLVSAAMLM